MTTDEMTTTLPTPTDSRQPEGAVGIACSVLLGIAIENKRKIQNEKSLAIVRCLDNWGMLNKKYDNISVAHVVTKQIEIMEAVRTKQNMNSTNEGLIKNDIDDIRVAIAEARERFPEHVTIEADALEILLKAYEEKQTVAAMPNESSSPASGEKPRT